MTKRFILLLDLAPGAVNLLTYAAEWATRCPAEFVLVHRTSVVAPALADVETKRGIVEHAAAEARRELAALARTYLPKGALVHYEVSADPLQRTLERLLAQPYRDLVLVGMKGTGPVEQVLVGSVALEVINSTGNCVVAVPKDVHVSSRITLHVSVSDKYPLNILELNNYLTFLEPGQVRITFFHLAAPGEVAVGMEQRLRELAELFGHRFATDHAVFEGADPFQDIRKVVTDRADEVLVVQRGSRLLTDQLFRKFLLNELVTEGHLPLVVLPQVRP